jgi:hypothetical protein
MLNFLCRFSDHKHSAPVARLQTEETAGTTNASLAECCVETEAAINWIKGYGLWWGFGAN